MPNLLTPLPFLDASGQPANGFIFAQATRTFSTADGFITTARSMGRVVNGVFLTADDSKSDPFVLVTATADAPLSIVIKLDSYTTDGRLVPNGGGVASRTVTVPDVGTVTWLDLVDVVAVADAVPYVIQPWMQDAMDNAAAASASASAAAASAASVNNVIGAANGVAPLDGSSKVPDANLPTRLGVSELSTTIDAPRKSIYQHRSVGGTEPGAFVSFTFDDGYGTAATYFDMLAAKGVQGTLFLSSGYVDRAGDSPDWPGDTFITTAQVNAIIAQGHEIGTHGVMHESYTAYLAANGPDALDTLITGAINDIETRFPGVTVKTGAYPYGHSTPLIRQIMGRTHEFYRGTKGRVAERGQDPFDVLSIDIQGFTESAVKASVDKALASRSLCVFLVHGALTATQITMLGNVIDYVASLGIPMGTFYDGMIRQTVMRGTAGASVDAAGNAYYETLRTTRVEMARGDESGDTAWMRLNPVTNSPVFDASGGNRWEFRKGLLAGAGLEVGERTTYADVTITAGSATATSPSAGFTADDVGRTISGTGIPASTTIIARASATSVTMSANATVTGVVALVTLGRTLGVTSMSGEARFYNAMKIIRASGSAIEFRTLAEVLEGALTPTTWSRAGAGGPMTIDSGTGGSTVTTKAYRLNLVDHTGARKLALCSSLPTDASLVAGEAGFFFDATAGALVIKGKKTDGTVVTATIAMT